jgi:hypothetical protein
MSSFAGVPDIVTAPLSAVTFKSLDVPLCALAVATVGVGKEKWLILKLLIFVVQIQNSIQLYQR